LIGRASWRHLVNVISWSGRASLFTSPTHTGKKSDPTVSIVGNADYRQHPLNELTIPD
jgi:hypothetical protein